MNLVQNWNSLAGKVHNVATVIDRQLNGLKLSSVDIGIDELTRQQKQYPGSWQEGTE